MPKKPILVIDAGGHTSSIREVLFTPDGRELITVSYDKTIRVWDVASGEPLRVLRPPIGRGSEGEIYTAALSPDGQILAAGGVGWTGGDHPVYMIALATGRIERVLKGHTNSILALAYAPDGRRLASGSFDQTARIWDTGSGRCEQVLRGHTAKVDDMAFSPDGHRLATASPDKTGRIWAVATGQVEDVLRGHQLEVSCVTWSPDGKVVATGSSDQSIRLWSPDGQSVKSFDNLGNTITSLTFKADSRGLLFTRGPGGAKICSLLDLATAREEVRFTKHTNSVVDGALSPDGSLAATTAGSDEVYLWKTATAEIVHRLAGKGRVAWSAAWSPDGKTIAWGDERKGGDFIQATIAINRAFHLGDLRRADAPDASFRRAQTVRGSLALEKSGDTTVAVKQGDEAVATLKVASEGAVITCFTMLPNNRAAVGTSQGRIYLFNVRSGERIRTFQGHTGVVYAVSPSPDGHFLLSASSDQTLRVWDLERAEPLVSLFFAGDEWVAWTPEGYYATSPGGERLMGWHVNNGPEAMASFFLASYRRKDFYRPDVIKLLLTTGSVERAVEEADKARAKATSPSK